MPSIVCVKLFSTKPEDRKIYMDRWESVKDAKVFAKNDRKGFSQNRFQRDEFKQIANRTPGSIVKSAYNQIKESLTNTKDKGDVENDR